MKQKDVILIVVIAVVAGILSFIISGLLFVTPENQQQKVEVAPVITTQFSTPDSNYFNSASINPTQTIQIGNSNNPAPFGNGQ